MPHPGNNPPRGSLATKSVRRHGRKEVLRASSSTAPTPSPIRTKRIPAGIRLVLPTPAILADAAQL
jgi:hypothetical protein